METSNNSSSGNIGETPHVPCPNKRTSIINNNNNNNTRSSYDSGDSGYITISPSTASSTLSYTPILNSSCRMRSGCSSNSSGSIVGKRRYAGRVRSTEPWQSERASRIRSKLINRLETSESGGGGGGGGDYHPQQQQLVNDNSKKNLNFELEGLIRVHNGDEQLTTSVPKTPASSMQLQLLSPPPSPAIPSLSFVACEPIEEDVEMKLVIVSQSTPHSVGSMSDNNCSISSPKTSRTSPVFNSIEYRNNLSKLMITELSMPDIVPKRLDFSQKPKYVGARRSRGILDQSGKVNVDFLRLLGKESNHWRIISKILSMLSSQDLCSISMVSKAWREICLKDIKAGVRRHDYIVKRQNAKENLKLIPAKAKTERDVSLASQEFRFAKKGLLMEVQNLVQTSTNLLTPSSPPVSPSKVKFHSFEKAGRTLGPSEYLRPCPRCDFACQVNYEQNIASCSRQGCSMEFCCTCFSLRHSGPCKTALLATPTKRKKRVIAGSRQSKRNLRRL